MRHAKRQLPLTEASAVIPGHLVFRVQPRPTSFLIFWLLCSLPSLQCLPTPWASPSLPGGIYLSVLSVKRTPPSEVSKHEINLLKSYKLKKYKLEN